MTRVLYPGSFDPVHNGHVEMVQTAAGLFDEVVVAALMNPAKGDGLFDLEERMAMLDECFSHLTNVRTTMFDGLVVDLAAEAGACLLYTSPSPRDKRQSRMPSSA